MVFQASGTRQYFLGIAGQQTGTFSDAEVLEKIRAGEIPADALVWYEGLPEWQAISTVEFFKEAFSAVPKPPPDATNVPVNTAPRPATSNKPRPGGSSPARKTSTRPGGAGPPKPVSGFAASEDLVVDKGGGDGKLKIVLGVVVALIVLGGGAMYFASPESSPPEAGDSLAKSPRGPKLPVSNPREDILRQAGADMMTHPDISLESLKKLVREKSDDATGKEALNRLMQYYRQNQRPLEAGSFLMELKRPQEAYKFFQADTSIAAQTQAEAAIFQAFQQSTDPAQRRDFLLNDIQILIQPLDKMDLALERIRLFTKTFPNVPHPYAYYLKSTDEKIAEIFNKISGYFVRGLVAYVASEFPEVHLDTPPIVEVRRDKPEQYRIAGRYKGKVRLRQDLLEDMRFAFWMVDGNWVVVETNLTTERQRWAQGNKARFGGKLMSGDQMLQYEQSIFKAQFPDASFHESGGALKAKKHTREE